MATVAPPIHHGHLIKSPGFDAVFIYGLLFLGLSSTVVIALEPTLFVPILVLDLWALGYHHVISTYTRLCFDRESFQEHKALLIYLLPVVFLITASVAWVFGLWVIATTYFYWQWWHYSRQSWGVSRVYRGKSRDALHEDGWLEKAIFYAVPVYGILLRSNQQHERFIGMELVSLPVPNFVVTIAGVACIALMSLWVAGRIAAWRRGRLAKAHTGYMVSHFTIFGFAYCLIPDITLGWLAINIWHNAQYILFVWLFNSRRFKDGVDPKARFLSYISQPNRLGLYLVTCLAITGVAYWGVLRTIDELFFAGIAATLVLYQTLNFHHYIVDSMIWKVRKPQMQKTLGM